jgi:hypothetical protein
MYKPVVKLQMEFKTDEYMNILVDTGPCTGYCTGPLYWIVPLYWILYWPPVLDTVLAPCTGYCPPVLDTVLDTGPCEL